MNEGNIFCEFLLSRLGFNSRNSRKKKNAKISTYTVLKFNLMCSKANNNCSYHNTANEATKQTLSPICLQHKLEFTCSRLPPQLPQQRQQKKIRAIHGNRRKNRMPMVKQTMMPMKFFMP